jgi:uncharacterized protein
MTTQRSGFTRLCIAAVVAAVTWCSAVPAHAASSLAISQVYGGGGNAGATFTNDFIELFNRGSAPVNLNGLSVQYAAAAGATWQVTALPNVTLQPGQYFLVQQGAGAGGTVALPAPDASGNIAMAATAGKVALVSVTTPLNGLCGAACASHPAVLDLVGYGTTAGNFEGAGAAPAPGNTVADLRALGGCTDSDINAADFATGVPTPRNTASPLNVCGAPVNQPVAASCPANLGAIAGSGAAAQVSAADPDGQVVDARIVSTPVAGITLADFAASPAAGANASANLTVAGSVALGTYNVQIAFRNNDAVAQNAACTVSVAVTNPAGAIRIRDIQGRAHRSPLEGQAVNGVPGIVTAKRSNGFYLQDPAPDDDPATSEGIFVFTSTAPTVNVGDAVNVGGTVSEFRPGGIATNLTITQIIGPVIVVISNGNPLPAPVIIGSGGRVPPNATIKNNCGDVESPACPFDPAANGLDFYESLEGMRVQINGAFAVGPTSSFGETPVIGDFGANATQRTARGGVYVAAGDFNPERILIDDEILRPLPRVNLGDSFSSVVGVIDYSFGNYKLQVTEPLTVTAGGLAPEVTTLQAPNQLAIASFNVENLDINDGPAKFATLAGQIVNNLKSPDIVALMEVQDNNGPTNDGVVDATLTFNTLITAIQAAGGPAYQFRSIDPVNNQDGGEPGGNIRVGYLFNPARVSFVDRPGGTATAATTVINAAGSPQLSFSPGRIDPANPAFNSSRKPLAGEFVFNGHKLFVIANHFNSKGGDDPLFGRFQPPVLSSETQRNQQATIVKDFVQSIFAVDSNAKVVVLGDLNDFEFSTPLAILKSAPLNDLVETLAPNQRYTYVFEGNSQVLDHILVSNSLMTAVEYDVVHVNSEFVAQASDHEPEVVRLFLPPAQSTSLLDVTRQMTVRRAEWRFDSATNTYHSTVRVTNFSTAPVAGPLQVRLDGLPAGVTLLNASGNSTAPYITLDTSLGIRAGVTVPLQLSNPAQAPITFTVKVFSGNF